MSVPSLRFPEFSGEWEAKRLGENLELFRKRVSATTAIPIYTSSRTGLRPQRDHFDGQEITNEGEYGVVPKGYFTYRHMSDDLTFKFNINDVHEEIAVSKEYPVFTTQNISDDFLHLKLNNSLSFRKFAAMQKLGGTRTRLYFKSLSEWKTLFPTLPEQKKIAAFLGVVDEKLAALRARRAGLETYKRGLMQKLFSRTLRFTKPDGSTFPNWEEKRLGEVASIKAGDFIKASEISSSIFKGAYECYGGNGSRGYVADYNRDGSLSLIGRQGALCGNVHFVTGKFYATEHALVADCSGNGDAQWLFYLLTHMNLNQYATGLAQPGVSADTVKRLLTNIPHPDEQRLIADALQAMDAKIEAVAQKITRMEAFKTGLLQQMFV